MLSPSVERLLQPSLSAQAAPVNAPFSATVQIMAAFFADVPGALVCQLVNIHRMRRWRQDGLPLLLLAVVALGLFALPRLSVGAPLLMLLTDWFNGTLMWTRFIALLTAGAGLWLHRRERRAADLMGLRAPHGLLPGIGIIVVGNALAMAAHALLKGLW